MIKKAKGQVDLKELEHLLQKRLQAEPLAKIPLQIHCLFREAVLVIFIRYPEWVVPYPKQIFSLIREALREKQIPEDYPVSMYLISQEQDRLDIFDRLLARSPQKEIAKEVYKVPTAKPEVKTLQGRQHNNKFWRPAIAWTVGIATILTIPLYALTRPCAIGDCPAIPQAKQSLLTALKAANISSSDEQLIAARQQIDRATETLENIPWWSLHRGQAQMLLEDYQADSDSLSKIVSAIRKSERAIALSEELTPAKTPNIQRLWQSAIAGLQKLPTDNRWYAIGQSRIQAYQKNLLGLDRRLQAQQNATNSLVSAKATAKQAQMLQNGAQTADDWYLARNTWQTAVKRLREIAPKTSEYREAQSLLKLYTAQSIAAGTRQKQERSAGIIYKQAIEQAELATNAQKQKQWSTAASNWRSALTYIQKVPRNTFQYRQAEPLISSYAIAFKRSMQYLQVDNMLGKICDREICNYAIADKTIKVDLTSSYIQQVWQTALQARANANVREQAALVDRIGILEKSLQSLSNTIGKRVEVYNSDKQLMIVYEPIK
jgi:hypothetical protein